MKIKFLLICISLVFSISSLNAQKIETWIDANEKVPVEKIYLHLDAEYYFQSDTIWFKVYLMDSRSGQLIPRAENIYVNLIDKRGNSIFESILLCNNGQASGNIVVPKTIIPGSFLLQAYTDYLLNFTDDAWFQKPLTISKNTTASRSNRNKNGTEGMVADVQFFPEGGFLLEGITNLVAFKAISKAGYGVNAGGSIKDERGNTVVTFKTDYKGMGLFFITPEAGKLYHAQIDGFPSFRFVFEAIKENLKIQLVNHTSKEIIVNIAGNSESFINKTFYLVNMHQGEVLFYQPFKMEGINQVLKYDSQILKPGINKLVLLTDELKPISERLLFSNNAAINQLEIVADKESYTTRSKVQLKIKDNSELGADEVSNLSISVLNKHAFGEFGKSQNILTHLLIDSELNNFFEPSAEFFMNTEISSDAKLKLLMLTNGWSNYFWNSAPQKATPLPFNQTVGLDLKGSVKMRLTEKPLENGEITLVIQKDGEVAFLTKETNKEGDFIFTGLLFTDTATIHIQAKNEKKNKNTIIEVSSPFINTEISESKLDALIHDFTIPSDLQNIKYKEYVKNRKYRSKNGRYRSNNIEVASTEKDGHFRLYDSADYVIELTENEETYDNVIDYLVGKVPGVDINGDDVRIRGTNNLGTTSIPLFLIDGIPMVSNNSFYSSNSINPEFSSAELTGNADERVIQSVKAIPINDVHKIEVLKSPQNLASFGASGANGVIAIYTRLGENKPSGKTAKGVIETQIVGYASQKIFYAPKYLPENKSKKSDADYRTTLFWDPNVTTQNGAAEVNFYTSDETGSQIVIIEGVTNTGKICLGEAVIQISK